MPSGEACYVSGTCRMNASQCVHPLSSIVLLSSYDDFDSLLRSVDPAAAMTFYQVASFQGLTLNDRRLKVRPGQEIQPTPSRSRTLRPLRCEEERVDRKHRGLRSLQRGEGEEGEEGLLTSSVVLNPLSPWGKGKTSPLSIWDFIRLLPSHQELRVRQLRQHLERDRGHQDQARLRGPQDRTRKGQMGEPTQVRPLGKRDEEDHQRRHHHRSQ